MNDLIIQERGDAVSIQMTQWDQMQITINFLRDQREIYRSVKGLFIEKLFRTVNMHVLYSSWFNANKDVYFMGNFHQIKCECVG